MKASDMCFIVDFDDLTRQACIEGLSSESFSFITFQKGAKKDLLSNQPAWATTIGFAQTIRKLGKEQSKSMTFKVVVACKETGVLRLATASEWIHSRKKRASLARTVSAQIKKIKTKRLVRGRLGTVSP